MEFTVGNGKTKSGKLNFGGGLSTITKEQMEIVASVIEKEASR